MTEPTGPDAVPVKQYDPERLPDLGEIIMNIRNHPAAWVDSLRISLDADELGQRARANCKERRLYAVLKPTKEESVRRIENIFRAMKPDQFEHARQASKEHLGL